MDELEKLEAHHKLIRLLIEGGDFDKIAKIMDSYTIESDYAEIKTTLIITKSFKEHPVLKAPRERIIHIAELILGKPMP